MRDQLVFLGIVTSFFISMMSKFVPSLTQFGVFFNIALMGTILLAYTSIRIWFLLGGFVFFSFVLDVMPNTFNVIFTSLYLLALLFFIVIFFMLSPSTLVGRVLVSDSKWAVVETEGNFFAGIPKGIYAAKSKRGIRKGDKVILKVNRKWGERELRILSKQS